MELLLMGTGLHEPSLPGDVGYNIIFAVDVYIPSGIKWVDVDARVKLPPNVWGFITARSSAAKRYGIQIIPGVIDNGYTGPLKVGIISSQRLVQISAGESVAQLVLMPMIVPTIRRVTDLPSTVRGVAGWGSTGK